MPDSQPPPDADPSGTPDDLRKSLDRIAAALEKGNEKGEKKEGDDGDKKEGEGKEGKEGGEGDKKRGPSKKVIIIGVIVVLLILGVVLFLWLNSRDKVSTDDAYTTGHVHAVSSRVAATVDHVDVDDNDLVTEGQILVHLDPRDYVVSRDKARANVAQAEAQLLQAHASATQSEAAILQAQAQVAQQEAQVKQAETQLELARINFNRNKGLFQRDARAVAQSDVDTTQSNLGGQQAQLDAAHANLDAARANVQAQQASASATQANVKVGEANVGAARAGLADAELQLSYCEIHAPVGGRISKKNAEEGQRVAVGQALLSVVPENVWVLANFKETQLERIAVGQRVDVEIDALPHHDLPGHGRFDPGGYGGDVRAAAERTTPRATSPRSSSACP